MSRLVGGAATTFHPGSILIAIISIVITIIVILSVMLPALAGTIERRFLINYRADPDVVGPHLPNGFLPQTVGGHAMVGICLIELRVRPARLPPGVGLRSFNGAHRYAVIDPDGQPAVYIPRRDTNSALVALLGGRAFPGTHHRAAIAAIDDGERFQVRLLSRDQRIRVSLTARPDGRLPPTSIFSDPAAASRFFELASTGYSDAGPSGTGRGGELEVLTLRTRNWSTSPLLIDRVESSYFEDADRFPPGSVVFDHALFMHDIDHTWHPGPRRPVAAVC